MAALRQKADELEGLGEEWGEASCQPATPLHTPTPSPEPSSPDVVTVGGALADEVVGLVQGLLPQVAGAIGFLGDHQHVLLEHQGPVTSCGPSASLPQASIRPDRIIPCPGP